MIDSSLTGSARTEVDAVDAFLKRPTTHIDFYRALQQSNKTAGDAGIANFDVNRTMYTWTPVNGNLNSSGFPVVGFVMRTPELSEFPSLTPFSKPNAAQIKVNGQGMYLRALPNRDQAALGTVLGEIVDNPVRALAVPGQALLRAAKSRGRFVPQLGFVAKPIQQRHRLVKGMPLEEARAAADDYLTYIFGVRPTVQDLDKLAESLTRSRQIAETVSRTGMKKVRRRRELPIQTRAASSVSNPTWTLMYPTGNTIGIYGTRTRTVEATQHQWFSASFRMSVSDTDNWLGQCSDLFHTIDRITGIGLDVKVAWDLIPFSFMADWFANTGDYLENRATIADYNIACEYGYYMCHTRLQHTLIASGRFGPYGYPAGGSSVSTSWTSLVETKMRRPCNAFGFNTPDTMLNSYQWGALTALGLSWAPGSPPKKRS
jgi:hypothetical protein